MRPAKQKPIGLNSQPYPAPGERWTHARNGRDVIVVGLRHSGEHGGDIRTEVDFRYVRGLGRPSIGFKRGVQPTQTYGIAEWRRHFTRS